MIRIIKEGKKFYGVTISSLEDDIENIEIFVKDAIPVLIVETIGDVEDFGLDVEDIQMID